DMCRGDILGHTVCPDTMYPQFSEPECKQSMGSFGRIPLSPIATIQLVANVGVHGIGGSHADTAIANEPPFSRQDNRQLTFVTWLFFAPGDEGLHKMTDIFLCSICPGIVPQI